MYCIVVGPKCHEGLINLSKKYNLVFYLKIYCVNIVIVYIRDYVQKVNKISIACMYIATVVI